MQVSSLRDDALIWANTHTHTHTHTHGNTLCRDGKGDDELAGNESGSALEMSLFDRVAAGIVSLLVPDSLLLEGGENKLLKLVETVAMQRGPTKNQHGSLAYKSGT